MIKILYLSYLCGIHLRIQTSSVALNPLCIMSCIMCHVVCVGDIR